MNQINLRGRVVSQYGSMSNLARSIGWSVRKTRAIIVGEQEPIMSDVEKLAIALNIENGTEFTKIFLPSLYSMWTSPNQ